jgi:xylose isomerase
LLEDAGWQGMRHFDAHAYRTEDSEGVWDFARGCMRTYLILKDKVRRFNEDSEIADALNVAGRFLIAEPTSQGGLGSAAIADVRTEAASLSEEKLAEVGYGHERLDQLVTELLLGVR